MRRPMSSCHGVVAAGSYILRSATRWDKSAGSTDTSEPQAGWRSENSSKKKFDHPGREDELQNFEKMQPAQPPQPPRSNKVAVFYRSTQRLELRDKEEITANISDAVRRQKLSRAPWNRDKDISLPSDKSKHVDKEDCECCRFDARVHHYRLGHLFWLKRLVGSVTEIYVFDYPLPKRSSAQSSPELH
ncbi:hypothetical protein HDK64DRAFT_277557 [Phyllosticta capitalensis]